MYIEKSLKEALEDYMLGRPVNIMWTGRDGGVNAMRLSDFLEQEENHYLVDMPDNLDQPAPEEIIQAVHDIQEDPEDYPPSEKAETELEEREVDPGDNSDRHLCMTCKYRGKRKPGPGRPKKGVKPGCDYYVITDHERGCDVEKCDKWEEE